MEYENESISDSLDATIPVRKRRSGKGSRQRRRLRRRAKYSAQQMVQCENVDFSSQPHSWSLSSLRLLSPASTMMPTNNEDDRPNVCELVEEIAHLRKQLNKHDRRIKRLQTWIGDTFSFFGVVVGNMRTIAAASNDVGSWLDVLKDRMAKRKMEEGTVPSI